MFEIIAIFVILALIGIDQLTKWLAVAHLQDGPAVLWDGVFELRYVENDGMAWGLFGGDVFRWVVVSITAVLMVVLLYMLLPKWLTVRLFVQIPTPTVSVSQQTLQRKTQLPLTVCL